MITIKNLKKSFGNTKILKGINWEIEMGKCNVLIGTSGSGKSVFLKCLTGLLTPDSGDIYFDNNHVSIMSEKQKRMHSQKIGMLFQGGALFDSMTVKDNILFVLDMHTTFTEQEKMRRIEKVLEEVHLTKAINQYPGSLSGGMKKRAALARAIVLNPKYLFCDEPNSGLDPQTSRVIDELIFNITKEYKTTTLIVSHDMKTVMDIGERVMYLRLGEKEWEGTNKEILKTDNKFLKKYIMDYAF
ncbi:MAG: ABC transporter ATP-binding protein [Chitinophagaceae bacterium]